MHSKTERPRQLTSRASRARLESMVPMIFVMTSGVRGAGDGKAGGSSSQPHGGPDPAANRAVCGDGMSGPRPQSPQYRVLQRQLLHGRQPGECLTCFQFLRPSSCKHSKMLLVDAMRIPWSSLCSTAKEVIWPLTSRTPSPSFLDSVVASESAVAQRFATLADKCNK